ncbi:MAG: malic enzyme-like NAD(P)-binding protein [Thermodesulfobacteriota bacterium]
MELHRRYQGVLQIKNKIAIRDNYILGQFYLPPLAETPARLIRENPELAYELTAKGNLVAIVTDGSAVLGLGNIGARAAMPVMEGKAILFQTFGGVEAFPICLATQVADEIVEIVKRMEATFGGINLEDISAPRCFYIERRLKEELNIPVFHDDQHGTAIVVTAALINALKISNRKLENLQVVVNGAGAAAIAVSKLLLEMGVLQLILCDTRGAIYQGRKEGMNWIKEEMAEQTNPERRKGDLSQVVRGADVFIGLSVAGALTQDMVRSMAKDPIIFALANPMPEIMPDLAKEAGALIVATGRSDFPNQVNNSLVFPGVFRGALDVRARVINEAMKIAASQAIAGLIPEKELDTEYIIPKGMDFRVPPVVAAAVARRAIETGVAKIEVDPEIIAQRTRTIIYEGELGYSKDGDFVLESAR